MRIGIIGAGNIGGTLTRRLSALGHEVSVANSRGPETLSDLADEIGATAVSVEDAPRDKDVIVVTIPETSVPDLPSGLFDGAREDSVVIDTGNYYPQQRDGRIEAIEDGAVESRWAQQQLGRTVIKAFNNIYADHLLERGRHTPGQPGALEEGRDPGEIHGLRRSGEGAAGWALPAPTLRCCSPCSRRFRQAYSTRRTSKALSSRSPAPPSRPRILAT